MSNGTSRSLDESARGRDECARGRDDAAERRRPEGDAERPEGRTGPHDAAGGRALSVTRPALISEAIEEDSLDVESWERNEEEEREGEEEYEDGPASPPTWRLLASGFDTVDVGLAVQWGGEWGPLSDELDRLKQKAAGTEGIPIWSGSCVMRPGGRAPMFRWHLQYPGFQLWLGKGEKAHGESPNAFVSLSSESLWRHGVTKAVENVTKEIRRLGGQVEWVKVSRADLAADFHVPGGLSRRFVAARRVPHKGPHEYKMNGGRLGTFYQGMKGPILCRIYDKGGEIVRKGTKLWFLDIWCVESLDGIWRIEFQVRREALKTLGIGSVDELLAMKVRLWQYLTEKWFSLRERDNPNTSRRTVTPFWAAVQGAFGEGDSPLLRSRPDDRLPSVEWYVSHVAGLLPGYAARRAESDFDAAWDLLSGDVRRRWDATEYADAYALKRIAMGRPVATSRTPDADAA